MKALDGRIIGTHQTDSMTRLRLEVTNLYTNTIIDVVDAWPSTFYSWLPDWLAQYDHCVIRATVIDGRTHERIA